MESRQTPSPLGNDAARSPASLLQQALLLSPLGHAQDWETLKQVLHSRWIPGGSNGPSATNSPFTSVLIEESHSPVVAIGVPPPPPPPPPSHSPLPTTQPSASPRPTNAPAPATPAPGAQGHIHHPPPSTTSSGFPPPAVSAAKADGLNGTSTIAVLGTTSAAAAASTTTPSPLPISPPAQQQPLNGVQVDGKGDDRGEAVSTPLGFDRNGPGASGTVEESAAAPVSDPSSGGNGAIEMQSKWLAQQLARLKPATTTGLVTAAAIPPIPSALSDVNLIPFPADGDPRIFPQPVGVESEPNATSSPPYACCQCGGLFIAHSTTAMMQSNDQPTSSSRTRTRKKSSSREMTPRCTPRIIETVNHPRSSSAKANKREPQKLFSTPLVGKTTISPACEQPTRVLKSQTPNSVLMSGARRCLALCGDERVLSGNGNSSHHCATPLPTSGRSPACCCPHVGSHSDAAEPQLQPVRTVHMFRQSTPSSKLIDAERASIPTSSQPHHPHHRPSHHRRHPVRVVPCSCLRCSHSASISHPFIGYGCDGEHHRCALLAQQCVALQREVDRLREDRLDRVQHLRREMLGLVASKRSVQAAQKKHAARVEATHHLVNEFELDVLADLRSRPRKSSVRQFF